MFMKKTGTIIFLEIRVFIKGICGNLVGVVFKIDKI